MSSLTNKIRHRDFAGVKESVSGGADISRKGKNGNIPLHIAAEVGDWEIARLLIEFGAPHNEKNGNEKLPSDINPQSTAAIKIGEAFLLATVQNVGKQLEATKL